MSAAGVYSLIEELREAIADDPARRPLIVCGARRLDGVVRRRA